MEVDAQLHETNPIDAVSLEQYHMVLFCRLYYRELAVGPQLRDQACVGGVSFDFHEPRRHCRVFDLGRIPKR